MIGTDYDDLEPNPVSPSVSSLSLVDNTSGATMPRSVSVSLPTPEEIVSSPNPTEDFSIHNTIGTSAVSGQELSPTTVTCTLDIKDFEHKQNTYVDALDWLMDDGWRQLPASDEEAEEDWSSNYPTGSAPKSLLAPPLSASKLAQVNSSALSAVESDVF